MLAFFVRRLFLALVVLLAVSFGSFWFFARNFYIAPGTMLPESPQSVWWHWLTGIPNGSLGRGVFGQPLWSRVVPALEHTLLLLAFAFVLVVVFALVVGTVSAVTEGSVLDVVLRAFSYAAWGMPAFLLGLILQRVLGTLWDHIHAQPLPLDGWTSVCTAGGFYNPVPCDEHGLGYAWGVAKHLVLPSFALATSFIGLHARYVRSSLLVALGAPYTATARAKGLTERRVVVRHALRNSLVTFVSALFLDFGSVFGAAMAVDWIFHLGGIGGLFVSTIAEPSIDPNAVQLILLLTAAMVLVSSLLAELSVGWLDPRVRLR